MAKLSIYSVEAFHKKPNNEEGIVVFDEREAHLKVQANNVKEAVDVAEQYLGRDYEVRHVSLNSAYPNIFCD